VLRVHNQIHVDQPLLEDLVDRLARAGNKLL
jgi:hypothetical protein